jgi:homospermidine synthase
MILSVQDIRGREKVEQDKQRFLQPEDIVDGLDELGVLWGRVHWLLARKQTGA